MLSRVCFFEKLPRNRGVCRHFFNRAIFLGDDVYRVAFLVEIWDDLLVDRRSVRINDSSREDTFVFAHNECMSATTMKVLTVRTFMLNEIYRIRITLISNVSSKLV